METPAEIRTTYQYFRIGVILKGVGAFLEIIGGLLALFISPATVASIGFLLTQNELADDPNDFIATHVLALTQHIAGASQTFAALYLLSHGIIKFILVLSLLKNKIWAYPASLTVFGLFVMYQSYLFYFNQSVYVAALTVFDLIVMWFIYREWHIVRERAVPVAS